MKSLVESILSSTSTGKAALTPMILLVMDLKEKFPELKYIETSDDSIWFGMNKIGLAKKRFSYGF